MTDAERRLWSRLRDRRLLGAKFVRQLPVGPYVADFACRERNLIVEVDGGQHADSAVDRRRTKILGEHGYEVIRFWNNDVLRNTEGVLQMIAEALVCNPSSGRLAPANLAPTGSGTSEAAASSNLGAQQPKTITIAAAILLDPAGRMLVVKKRGSPCFIQPGGKIEANESPEEALRRELREEIAVEAEMVTPLGLFSAPAANEPDATVVAHIFTVKSAATPKTGAEIESMAWIDCENPGEIGLAQLTRDHMLPLAQQLGAKIAGEVK